MLSCIARNLMPTKLNSPNSLQHRRTQAQQRALETMLQWFCWVTMSQWFCWVWVLSCIVRNSAQLPVSLVHVGTTATGQNSLQHRVSIAEGLGDTVTTLLLSWCRLTLRWCSVWWHQLSRSVETFCVWVSACVKYKWGTSKHAHVNTCLVHVCLARRVRTILQSIEITSSVEEEKKKITSSVEEMCTHRACSTIRVTLRTQVWEV